MARLCLESANTIQSKKWAVRGQLLIGQSLLKLGRFGEAVIALKTAAIVACEGGNEKDQSIVLYIQSLIDQVTNFLRRLNRRADLESESRRSCSDLSEKSITKGIDSKTEDTASSDNSEDSKPKPGKEGGFGWIRVDSGYISLLHECERKRMQYCRAALCFCTPL
jgi:hypothetical protein